MQGLGFAIAGALRRLLCGAGLHDHQPVALKRVRPEHVLLRCEFCPHTRLLRGHEAREWIKRAVEGE